MPSTLEHDISFYPAFLDLTDRPVVIVGGGPVAAQKVAGLLAAKAQVTVIAPAVVPEITDAAASGRLIWKARRYEHGDLAGVVLAFAATDDPDVNRAVWREAETRAVPVNAADDPPNCTFILPAVHRDGDLIVAVSTGGKAPALAVRLRDRIAADLGGSYDALLRLLAGFRAQVTEAIPTFSGRRDLWYRIVDAPVLDHLRRGDPAGARSIVADLIDSARPSRRGATS